MTNTAGGRFAIDSTTGVITVADGSLLNFEVATTHTITVRVTDQGGLTYNEAFTINLTNVNEAPSDMGFGTRFVGDASTVVSAGTTVAAANDFTIEIKATPREEITLVAQSNSGIASGTNGGMAVMADQGDSAWGTAGGATRSVGLAIGTNGVVVYQHSSSIFSSLLTYSGAIQRDSDIAVVFVNKTPTLYINGVLVATGIQSDGTNVRASVGWNATSGIGGGSSVGGRYFNGTLSDYRVWNSSLDATTINNNRTTAFATGTPGLLANLIATSIDENAANGTVVGRARGYDPDAGATLGYSLTDNAGGRFTINNTTGEITVANSSLLDFETATNHTITVRTTDQAGLTYDENVTVRLRNINEAPTALTLTGVTTGAGSSAVYNATLDSYYVRVATMLNWEAAMDNAQASLLGGVSGTLAVINSVDEANFLFSLNGLSNFIGYSDKLVEGVWMAYQGDTPIYQVWSDGATGTSVGGNFTNFASGQPNNSGSGEDYGIFQGASSQTWNDVDLSLARGSFVEWTGAAFRAAQGVNSSVLENVAAGTFVGTLAATDADAGETYTYSIVGSSSLFEIVGNELRVKAGATFDYEASQQHALTIRVTDSGSNTRDQAIIINVVNVNEAPTNTGVIGSTNLVNNSSFETDLSGWTTSGSVDRFSGQGATNGTFGLRFSGGDTPNDGVASTVITTVVGQTYTVTFDMGAHAATLGLNSPQLLNFQVLGGATIVNETVADAGSGPNTFNSYRYTFVADSTSTTLRFADVSSATLQVNIILDNVQAYAVTTSSPTMSIAENSSNGTMVGQVTSLAPDAYSVLSYSLTDTAGGRFAIDTVTGQVSVADGSLLNFETTNSYSITVRTTDQGGLTFDKVVTINLTNVNEGPTAISDSVNAVEAGGMSNSAAGTNPTGNVLTNDTDVDAGDTKTVSGVAAGVVGSASTNVGSIVAGSFGSINIAADGSYSYSVDNTNATVQALRTSGQTLTDVFTYTMRDTAGLTSTTQITVTIQGANDTPHDITTSGSLAVNETVGSGGSIGTAYDPGTDQPIVATLGSSDVDSGDSFSYSIVGGATTLFEVYNGNQLRVKAGASFDFETATSHSVIIRSTDAAGATFDKSITINVVDYEGPPTSLNGNVTQTGTSEEDAFTIASGSNNIVNAGAGIDTINIGGWAWGEADGGADGDLYLVGQGGFIDYQDTGVSGTDIIRATGNGAHIRFIGDVTTASSGIEQIDINNTSGTIFEVQSGTLNLTNTISIVNGTFVSYSAYGNANIIGTSGADVLGLSGGSNNSIQAGSGDDTIYLGGWSWGTVDGGEGSDLYLASSSGFIALTDSGTTGVDVMRAANNGAHFRFNGLATATSTGLEQLDLDGRSNVVLQITGAGGYLDVSSFTIVGGSFVSISAESAHDATIIGTSQADNNYGQNGNDTLSGGLGADTINGGQGHDTITGGEGNDAIDGGLGNDIAIYSGNWTDYTITFNAGTSTYTLVDNRGGSPDGTDTVTNVETFRFNGVDYTAAAMLNDAPTAVVDTATAVEAGGVANGSAGSNPTGNVLSNDTDPDNGDTKTVTGVTAGVQASATGSVASNITGSYRNNQHRRRRLLHLHRRQQQCDRSSSPYKLQYDHRCLYLHDDR